MKVTYPVMLACWKKHRSQFAIAAAGGQLADIMKACTKCAAEIKFLHGQTTPTPGVS
jgi:hypothetical protein